MKVKPRNMKKPVPVTRKYSLMIKSTGFTVSSSNLKSAIYKLFDLNQVT